MPAVRFLFDLGSPYAYLAAERIGSVFGGIEVSWQPVLLGGLFAATGRGSWAVGDPARRAAGMADIEGRAERYGLPPLRWPEPWPGNYLFAMRAATFAAREGVGERFARVALRAAFAEGVNLSVPEGVLVAAERAGLDLAAVEAAVADPGIKGALRAATDAAHAAGVFGVPSVIVGENVFWGDDRLVQARAAIGSGGSAGITER